jgi:cysteinyl-tRNA synthetase
LTDEMTAIFHEDARALGCLLPTHEPRATEHIAQMIAIIERLIAKGHAYVAAGHVLFDVPSMPAYGKLSKRPLDEMIAGARVEVAPYKRGPMDFVLWKPSSPDQPGWESPWGRGRPGWHIECSAMSSKYLGEIFDIHGGGIDLVFPHHENEIAQSCCAFGHDVMANVWMHNGHLQVEGEKMSKSVGNFVTIHELLNTKKFGEKKWPGEVLRLAILKTHYRQPIDFTVKALEEAKETCGEWIVAISTAAKWMASQGVNDDVEFPESVLRPLIDDLNTPAALAAMHELHAKARANDSRAALQLKASLELLGIHIQHEDFKWDLLASQSDQSDDLNADLQLDDEIAKRAYLKDIERLRNDYLRERGVNESVLDALVAARKAARKNKNFAESDRIRAELDAMGVVLKDNKGGTTTWEPKR